MIIMSNQVFPHQTHQTHIINDNSLLVSSNQISQSKIEPNEICRVCEDEASGRHYGAITCEGCKGFFRRIIVNNNQKNYRCNADNKCVITQLDRRKCCKACRFMKCISVGMDPKYCVKINENNKDDDIKPNQSLEQIRLQIEKKFTDTMKELSFTNLINTTPNEYLISAMGLEIGNKIQQFYSGIKLMRVFDNHTQTILIDSALNSICFVLLTYHVFKYTHFRIDNFELFKDDHMNGLFKSIAQFIIDRQLFDERYICPIISLCIANPDVYDNENTRQIIKDARNTIINAFRLNEIELVSIEEIVYKLMQYHWK